MGTSKYVTIIRKTNTHSSSCQTVQMSSTVCCLCEETTMLGLQEFVPYRIRNSPEQSWLFC